MGKNGFSFRSATACFIAIIFVLSITGFSRAEVNPRYKPIGPQASVKKSGLDGEITTVFGTGAQGQSEYTMDHPRLIQKDSKGRIWFVDGSQKNAKLRYLENNRITTVADLVKSKFNYQGYFLASGLAIMNDKVYLAGEGNVFTLTEGHIIPLDSKINKYMKENQYAHIFRMEQYKGELYLMLLDKSFQYGFVKYSLVTKKIEEVLPRKSYNAPMNFYVHDKGILIACKSGYILYEQFFPRQSYMVLNASEDAIMDVFLDQNKDVYYMAWANQSYVKIKMLPYDDEEAVIEVAGSIRGYQDGYRQEAQMDYSTDFYWDGSGMLFGDMGNHAIRKLWLSTKPSNAN
ncbi:hypothetical protein [Brevibacillus reuszeri]|uniref:hypothetical protein n=1 Tax=Brevibacillus reuszeri TaxID=54915 RepID=UPI003D1D7D54